MSSEKTIAIALEETGEVEKITNQLKKMGIQSARIHVLIPTDDIQYGGPGPTEESLAAHSAVAGAVGALLGALLVGITMAQGATPFSMVGFPFAVLASLVVGATVGGLSGWPMMFGAFESNHADFLAKQTDHLTVIVVTADEFTVHKIQKMYQRPGTSSHVFLDHAQ